MERHSVAKKDYDIEAGISTITFTGGHVITARFADFPENIKTALGLHGLNQKLGDSYAGSKGDVDDAIESAQSVLEQLLAGEWSKTREAAGPRPSMVADAVVNTLRANGHVFADEAAEAATRAKYMGKDSAANRKNALENKQVKTEYEKLRVAAAQARLEAAEKEAGNAPADVSSLA
jgi:hypothetical protein